MLSRQRIIFILRCIYAWRDYLIAVVTPLILSLFFLYDGTETQKPARCTFVLLMLVIFWTTECIPIAVTAVLPMFLYPILEISKAKDLAPKYMSEVNMAFIGSYIMVLAFEHANLHKRFALRILMTVGAQPRWILFGIMMSSCFLSMFTNNAMSCALHLPIVKGIIDELREVSKKHEKNDDENSHHIVDMSASTGAISSSSTSALVHQAAVKTALPKTNSDVDDVLGDATVQYDDDTVTKSVGTCTSTDIEMGTLEQPAAKKTTTKSILKVKATNNDKEEKMKSSSSTVALTSPDSTMTLSAVGADDADGGVLSTKVIDGIEKMLLISAAYSASIGGMCTLIGTPTNLIMKERADQVFDQVYKNCPQPVTFTSWLVFGVPVGYLFIFVAWFWLQMYFLGPKYVFDVWILDPFRRYFTRNEVAVSKQKAQAELQAERITSVVKQLFAQLEPMGFQQYAVLSHCIVLVILLITRQLSTGEKDESGLGWDAVAPKFTKESTATILMASSLFVFPSSWPSFRSAEITVPPPLLKWKHVDREFPFGVILLLGGGMAAAAGAQDSGLPNLIAPFFGDLMKNISIGLCVLLIAVLVAAMTEVMSNIACVTLIAPIMEKLAKDLGVSPLLFLFPTTLSSSFAFMLPVATPANALVFSTNRLRIIDMVLCGVGMNIIGVFIVALATTTWVVTPLILSLLFLYDGTETQKPARCTFVLLMLVIFWTTECIPIAVTALLPMFLYPILEISKAKDLAPKYMSEVNMAFIGSYIMVLAFEHANLHKRFALRILLTVGAQPRWLLFGIMMSACFLSMFTNNTMSCALHLPIVKGIIDELREISKKPLENRDEQAKVEVVEMSPVNERSVDEDDTTKDELMKSPSKVALTSPDSTVSLPPPPDDEVLSTKVIDGIEKMLLISAAYSASIGGMCTLIGTPTNLVMKERADQVFDQIYKNCSQPITFTSWLVFGLPVGYMVIFFAWFWLQVFFLGPRYVLDVWILDPFHRYFSRKEGEGGISKEKAQAALQAERITTVVRQLYAQLEPMGFQQYAVLCHCVILVIFLITRQLSTGEKDSSGLGWDAIAPKFTKESTATILMASSLFVFPSSWPSFRSAEIKVPPPLLKWKDVDREFPFGVILLVGGGMAAAGGAQDSGLPNLIAPFFGNIMKDLSLGACVLLTSVFIACMTEFMSNIACVILVAPIMEKLATDLNVSPLLFLFPTVLSSSFAFMLPVATPPNALVFSTNRLKIIDMVLCGVGMNIIGIFIVCLATNTWGNAYFSLYKPPCSD